MSAVEQLFDEPEPDVGSKMRARSVKELVSYNDKVTWLHRGFLQVGELNAAEGLQREGKTTYVYDLIARLSRGDDFIDGYPNKFGPLNTLVIDAGENNISAWSGNQLDAMGCDLERVFFLTNDDENEDGRIYRDLSVNSLPQDLPQIERHIVELNIQFVFLDGATGYLGIENINDDAKVRAGLKPLRKLAEKYNITVLYTRHHSKGGTKNGQDIRLRGIGAQAWTSLTRATMIFRKIEEDGQTLFYVAADTSRGKGALGFSFKMQDSTKGEDYPEIVLNDIHDMTANELLSLDTSDNKEDKIEACKKVIANILGDGEMEGKAVKAKLEASKFSRRVINEASRAIVDKKPASRGKPSIWSLRPSLETIGLRCGE